MRHTHASTPSERVAWVGYLLAHAGEYGVVTALSRTVGVSRQTLYTWAERGRAALEQAFTSPVAAVADARLERDILTLLVEGHASYRGIRRCLRQVGRRRVSLGTISAVVREAERRALALVARLTPPQERAVALDEIYGRDRQGAYLHIVDVESGAVWAAEGPVPVDGETWTLVLWLAQERGLRVRHAVSDGGAAMAQGLRTAAPHVPLQRDVWHVLHQCGQVQRRLDRPQADVEERTATVARQAARVAAGQRPQGQHPVTDVAAHGAARHDEATTLLTLLAQARDAAPGASRHDLTHLHTARERALPGLLVFAAPLDGVQQETRARLGRDALSTLTWAWQRRAALGPTQDALLALLPPAWRRVAAALYTPWEATVRASSAVENWHSVLRPHLAVHRTLPSGLLALLTVWHNHQVSPRGLHHGQSPLQRSGLPAAPTDWLVALGYPPATDDHPLTTAPGVLKAA
ncbi:MAG: hypothetical protein LC769_05580 [Chloroflexi bacterium]|nr:hypothetical protein [Chloroflexota bacterium]